MRGRRWTFTMGMAKYPACVAVGIIFYLLAGMLSGDANDLSEFTLKRNPCGYGDVGYSFYVDGLTEEPVRMEISLGEQKMSKEQGKQILRQAAELLCERAKGDNPSFREVRADLKLPDELPEYGLTVSWTSERPEVLSSMGIVRGEGVSETGETVYLKAILSNGIFEETVELPVTIFPQEESIQDRFKKELEAAAFSAQTEGNVGLPHEFEGRTLSYRTAEQAGNEILLVLGVLAAGILYMKEKADEKRQKEKRESSLLLDYSEALSRFVVLTGAGYTIRQAWKRMVLDYEKKLERGVKREKPVYAEMRTVLNQMETGIPELQAYGNFGRNCGLRCYVRFASLLTNNLHTGGKNLRNLLEEEVEAAFEQRKDLARRLGEEASTKLLIPLFLMLGVVMMMIVSPAFLTLG